MYGLPDFRAVLSGKYQLGLPCAGHFDLRIFINIAVGMSRQRNRLFPVLHAGLDTLNNNRRTKHRAIQCRTYGTVRALPHLL